MSFGGNRQLMGASRGQDTQPGLLSSAVGALFEPAQLRETLLNILIPGGAIALLITVATALLVVPYWLFFVES